MNGIISMIPNREFKLSELSLMNSSASEIDSVSNVIDSRLAKMYKLFRQAANKVNTNVKYIVVGDSTRDNTYNEMIEYYNEQLGKINVTVFNNSESGQSGHDWAYNIDQTTLNQCLSEIGDNEENCIVEFSHGLNDYKDGNTESQVKTWLLYGINQLILNKPKINIVLTTPVNTAYTDRNIVLKRIYSEISTELNLPLVDTTLATAVGTIQGNTNYYQDTTHPNKFGSRRVVNYILDTILPLELLSIVTISEYEIGTALDYSLTATKEIDKLYDSTTGVAQSLANWRRLAEIPVEPNFVVKITHKGNRNDNIYMDSDGVFISVDRPTVTLYVRYSTIPANAWFLRINLSSQGATYDALNDVPTVSYYDPSSGLYLTIEDINSGLNIRNVLNKFRDGLLVDSYGKIGTSGQTLTIDANSKMKWA